MKWLTKKEFAVIVGYLVLIGILSVAIFTLWLPVQRGWWIYQSKKYPRKYDRCSVCGVMYPHKLSVHIDGKYYCRDRGTNGEAVYNCIARYRQWEEK